MHFMNLTFRIQEGDIGVCGIAVSDHFSCGISGILISNCGIAVLSGPAGCGFLAFSIHFGSNLLRFPSFFYLPIVSETS